MDMVDIAFRQYYENRISESSLQSILEDMDSSILAEHLIDVFNRKREACNFMLTATYGYELPDNDRCPYCGAEVVLKSGRYGYFWGCTAYPDCHFSVSEEAASDDGRFSQLKWESYKTESDAYGEYIASLNGG